MAIRILIAPDSFKGSLTASAAAAALARGARAVRPDVTVRELPLSDGGEGLVETLAAASGTLAHAEVQDAAGRPVRAPYARLDGGRTVAMAVSGAAGLHQIPVEARRPLVTTTRGAGELVAAAWAERPFERLILGAGGSATVDGGMGLLQALGVRFLDREGADLGPGGGELGRLAEIDATWAHPALREAEIAVAADVANPLLGERGAARVYGPQKGASAAQVERLEAGMERLAEALERATGRRVGTLAGGGAAGGVPASLVAVAGAEIRSGFDLVAELVDLDAALADAQLVVSGEGQLDAQSFEGKVVGSLAARCQARGLPLAVVAGALTPQGERLLGERGGVGFPLVPGPLGLDAAMARADELLERAAVRIMRAFNWRSG